MEIWGETIRHGNQGRRDSCASLTSQSQVTSKGEGPVNIKTGSRQTAVVVGRRSLAWKPGLTALAGEKRYPSSKKEDIMNRLWVDLRNWDFSCCIRVFCFVSLFLFEPEWVQLCVLGFVHDLVGDLLLITSSGPGAALRKMRRLHGKVPRSCTLHWLT